MSREAFGIDPKKVVVQNAGNDPVAVQEMTPSAEKVYTKVIGNFADLASGSSTPCTVQDLYGVDLETATLALSFTGAGTVTITGQTSVDGVNYKTPAFTLYAAATGAPSAGEAHMVKLTDVTDWFYGHNLTCTIDVAGAQIDDVRLVLMAQGK